MEVFDGSALKFGDSVPLASNFHSVNGAADLVVCLESAVVNIQRSSDIHAYFLRHSKRQTMTRTTNYRTVFSPPRCN
jgi:hypothetical protein